jgi:hypothetical protein
MGVLAVTQGACAKQEQPPQQAAAPAGPAKGTPEWKIENAMSAAPRVIASAAAIMDWPSSPTAQMTQLRAGTNGWSCISDNPTTPSNDPFCWDAAFGEWVGAWMAHKPPHIRSIGLSYMLQGATDASNTDPYKGKPDSGQGWVVTGPHLMIVLPDARSLAGLSTDWKSGGPYVMFAGTPYAHVMVPIAPAKADSGMSGMQM